MVDFGCILREVARHTRLKQAAISSDLGLTQPQYSRLCNNKNALMGRHYERLAELLGLSVIELSLIPYLSDEMLADLQQTDSMEARAILDIAQCYGDLGTLDGSNRIREAYCTAKLADKRIPFDRNPPPVRAGCRR